MKINKRNPWHWYYLGLQGLFTLCAVAVRPFLTRRKPHIIVLYGHQLSGHLAAIYYYWKANPASDVRCCFLTLNPSPALPDPADQLDLLYCHKFSDMLVVAKAAAMITDHGLHLMFPLVSLTSIVFVDVGHGIPFKGYDARDFRLQRRYKEIWTSSRGVAGLYESKCGCKNLVIIGSPRTDKLIVPHVRERKFRQNLGIEMKAPLVLYAPTWQQDQQGRELIPFGETAHRFFGRIGEVCQKHSGYLIVRSHQNAAIQESDCDHVFFCPQIEYPDTEALLLETDVLVSDWSSIVFDFLVLDRPTVFLDVPPPFAKGCTLGPEYRFGDIVADMDSLVATLAEYLENPDSYWGQYAAKQRSVKSFVYDENADGHASERGLRRLEALLS